MERIVEHTADGSSTLYIPQMDEHYHSVKGAETESQHVFIDMGMKEAARTTQSLRILEVGFGTGLNAWLSLKEAQQSGKQIHYTTIEFYPLPWDTVNALQYSDASLFRMLHQSPWDVETGITPHFILHKIKADFTHYSFDTNAAFDVVYFDAFAPEKQPEMWKQGIFNTLYHLMSDTGILTTYCAKGVVRRMLQQSGFAVERLPGPPGGKREILRARKQIVVK